MAIVLGPKGQAAERTEMRNWKEKKRKKKKREDVIALKKVNLKC